jgi:quinol monooxygenase YgiN
MNRYIFALALAIVVVLSVTTASSQQSNVRLFVRHEVNDYAVWRKAYDGFDADRRAAGVTGAAVYRSIDNPNDVTVWHEFASADKAKAFAASEKLKNVMKDAGVKGAPQIWFTFEAK